MRGTVTLDGTNYAYIYTYVFGLYLYVQLKRLVTSKVERCKYGGRQDGASRRDQSTFPSLAITWHMPPVTQPLAHATQPVFSWSHV